MTRSGFACIRWDSSGVVWASTDPALFEAVLADLAQMVPGSKIVKNAPKTTLVAPYASFNTKLGGNDSTVAWWIMKQLCEKGWEPFEVSESSFEASHGYFYLRLIGRDH